MRTSPRFVILTVFSAASFEGASEYTDSRFIKGPRRVPKLDHVIQKQIPTDPKLTRPGRAMKWGTGGWLLGLVFRTSIISIFFLIILQRISECHHATSISWSHVSLALVSFAFTSYISDSRAHLKLLI